MIIIRRAEKKDIDGIINLLEQVLLVHHKIKPDLFLDHGTKYTKNELEEIILNDQTPLFVAVDDNENVLGHCFTQFEHHSGPNIVEQTSLYIDDLCVDEKYRGQHVGKKLYEHVLQFAKSSNVSRVTLHVWEGNDSALKFYESLGFTTYMQAMEIKL